MKKKRAHKYDPPIIKTDLTFEEVIKLSVSGNPAPKPKKHIKPRDK